MSLWPDASDTRGRVLTESRTDRQGRFSLEAPAEGRYRIAAELEHRDILHATSQGLDVGRGGAQVRLRFEVGRRLSGVVVDRSGQPIPDAHLTVLPALHTPACSDPSLGVFTDANGRFTFQGISGEQLTLHVWKDGYLDASRDGVSRSFPLEPGDRDVRLVLPRLAGVRGRFVRADGSPIMLFHLNGEEHEDEEGRFFLPIHSTGTMTLELAEPGSPYAPVRRTLAVQQEVGVELGTITPVP
ncbi:carboxypeptidase-like regulatory domain-containing protein [Archangium lansingense]|uniref:carboxypeptidase-like regulatory domain-containing protein n=1 Tax=Archangium lansingense TaxID=2995310 RepID=UPI003B765971